jgi:hypothetical protein
MRKPESGLRCRKKADAPLYAAPIGSMAQQFYWLAAKAVAQLETQHEKAALGRFFNFIGRCFFHLL